MSDLVERLRALYRGYRQHYIIADAADEIERLRAELATSREMCTKFELAVGDDLGEIMQLRAQVARLLSGLSSALGYMRNADIDLSTGAPKKTAQATIRGGIKMAEQIMGDGDSLAITSTEGK